MLAWLELDLNQSPILRTDGSGYWSKQVECVKLSKIDLNTDNQELRVFFDTASWNVNKYGLIYTDERFIKELRALLNLYNLPGADVHYSEQGMQGVDYVSLDVGTNFIDAWLDKYGNV